MLPNSETGQFELNREDRLALGAPMFDRHVAFDDAPRLLNRAEKRLGETEKPAERRVLKELIHIMEPYLPDVSSGAEAFLKDYNKPRQ